MKKTMNLTGISTVSIFLLTLSYSVTVCAQSRPVTMQLDLNKRTGELEIDRFALGQGGLSEDPMWADRAAEIRALRPRLIRLFIQEYFDLLPERGRYHFKTLDQSVDLINSTGATPVMCIAFKPKVLFPTIDHKIVEPVDYDEWEKLIYHMVKHYRERGSKIRYWEVSNEPDIGESGGCPYLFTPENYRRYYARTVAAILRADPEARVGGPALANYKSPILPSLLEYCEKEKVPLHFVSWHIYSSDPLRFRATIDEVKALIKKHPSLNPETMLNEWNMSLSNPSLDPRFQPCFIAEVAWQMKEAGLDYSCYYHIRDYHVRPEVFSRFMSVDGTAFMARWWNQMPQFDGLFDFQNRVRPAYFLFKLLSRLSGQRLPLQSNDPHVHGFAAYNERLQAFNILVWNFSNQPARLDLKLEGDVTQLVMRRSVLDATGPSDDENERIRWQQPFTQKIESANIGFDLDSYGISFISLERRRQ
jgi:xylan 1,4-beta-xylosidase